MEQQNGYFWERLLRGLRRGPAPVVSQEPTQGWWTANPKWGGRVQQEMPPEEGSILHLTELPSPGGPPRSIGVTLFRNARSTRSARNADVYCRLTYGAGGVSNTVLLDWENGGTFAVQANTVRIEAVTYRPNLSSAYDPTNVIGAIAEIALGCTLGIDGAPPPHAPSFTPSFETVAATSNMTVAIPEFARVAVPFVATPSPVFPAPALASFEFNSRGLTNTLQTYVFSNELITAGAPLPPSAILCSLRNNTVADQNMGIKFLLGL